MGGSHPFESRSSAKRNGYVFSEPTFSLLVFPKKDKKQKTGNLFDSLSLRFLLPSHPDSPAV